jgi:hypothetical protein
LTGAHQSVESDSISPVCSDIVVHDPDFPSLPSFTMGRVMSGTEIDLGRLFPSWIAQI